MTYDEYDTLIAPTSVRKAGKYWHTLVRKLPAHERARRFVFVTIRVWRLMVARRVAVVSGVKTLTRETSTYTVDRSYGVLVDRDQRVRYKFSLFGAGRGLNRQAHTSVRAAYGVLGVPCFEIIAENSAREFVPLPEGFE